MTIKRYDGSANTRKLFWLFLAFCLLLALLAQSYFEYECRSFGTHSAHMSIRGVTCSYEFQGFMKFITLEELHARHDDKLKMEACVKAHPENSAVCDPRYSPPVPTVKIETG